MIIKTELSYKKFQSISQAAFVSNKSLCVTWGLNMEAGRTRAAQQKAPMFWQGLGGFGKRLTVTTVGLGSFFFYRFWGLNLLSQA